VALILHQVAKEAKAMLRAIPNKTADELTRDEIIHRRLASSHRQRLSPRRTAGDFDAELEQEASIRRLERRFVEAERAATKAEARGVPTDPAGFADWFASLNATGAGQNDALLPWLAEHAQSEQLSWFLEESSHEIHFADLVALTQVNMPSGPKLELVRNLWDETARHHTSQEYRSIPSGFVRPPKPAIETIAWESLALGNLMVALATARHYAFQSLGALAVIELTAPAQTSFVRAGLERVFLRDARAEQYLSSRANFDALHATAWLQQVLQPLVASDATLATVIAEGALLRLNAQARCFERYRREFASTRRVVACFEYADEPTSAPEAEPRKPQPTVPRAPAFRPVKWREVHRSKPL